MGLYFGVAPKVSRASGAGVTGGSGRGQTQNSKPCSPLVLHKQASAVPPEGREGRGLSAAPPSRDRTIMAAAGGLPGSRKQAVRGGRAAGTGAGAGEARAAGRPGAGRVRSVPADRGSR